MIFIFKRLLFIGISVNLFVFATSCKNDKSPLAGFATLQSKTLKGQDIPLASDTILYLPYSFRVADTLGFFNDNAGRTGATIVNLKTGRLIKRFAFIGDKPSEFDINAISFNSVVQDKSGFSILQMNPPCKIFRYNLDSLLHQPIYKPAPLFYPNNFGYNSAFILNDSTILGQVSYSKFDDKIFAITNIVSNKLITGLDLPPINGQSLQDYYKDPLYYKLLKGLLDLKLRYRPGSNFEFAYFSRLGAVMQIFNVDKNYNFKVKYEKTYYLPSFTVISTPKFNKPKLLPDSKFAFNDVTVTKDKIYVLFNGPDLTTQRDFCDDILVYDWNGKPIEKIKLAQKCRNITIDENNPKILYGLYGTVTNTRIIKYILP